MPHPGTRSADLRLVIVAASAALAAVLSACGSGGVTASSSPASNAQSSTSDLLGAGADSGTSPAASPAAGSDTGGGSTTQAVIDACQLVTRTEAQAVVQTGLQDGVDDTDQSTPGCVYTGPATGPPAQVEIHVRDGAKQTYDTDRRIGHAFTTVPSLGDEGYIEDGVIFFRKGSVWVSIAVQALDVDSATLQAGMPGLARTALSRLPAGA